MKYPLLLALVFNASLLSMEAPSKKPIIFDVELQVKTTDGTFAPYAAGDWEKHDTDKLNPQEPRNIPEELKISFEGKYFRELQLLYPQLTGLVMKNHKDRKTRPEGAKKPDCVYAHLDAIIKKGLELHMQYNFQPVKRGYEFDAAFDEALRECSPDSLKSEFQNLERTLQQQSGKRFFEQEGSSSTSSKSRPIFSSISYLDTPKNGVARFSTTTIFQNPPNGKQITLKKGAIFAVTYPFNKEASTTTGRCLAAWKYGRENEHVRLIQSMGISNDEPQDTHPEAYSIANVFEALKAGKTSLVFVKDCGTNYAERQLALNITE